jgi:filamentous hemagglutinin
MTMKPLSAADSPQAVINIGAFGQTNSTENILVSGSNITSQTGTIQLQGTHNVTIEVVNEHHESLDESRITKKEFLSSKTTETRDYQLNILLL